MLSTNRTLPGLLGMVLLVAVVPASQSQEWQYGIGSGFYALGINGDAGFNSPVGPITFDADLGTSDVQDALETAYGFAGYAKKNQLTILYNFGYFELEDDVSATREAANGRLDISYKSTRAEVALDYLFAIDGNSTFGALVGVRYIKKEFDSTFSVDGESRFTGSVDENWVDLVLGLTHNYPLTKHMLWTSRIDVGFGGSEGSYFFDTGISWKFAPAWSARVYGSIIGHDFEQDDRGDANWFFFDVDEFGAGIALLYHF